MSNSKENLFGVTLSELVIVLFFIMLLLALDNIGKISDEKDEIEKKYIEITQIESNADGDIVIPSSSWNILIKTIWGDSEDQPVNSDLVPVKQVQEKIKEITNEIASTEKENERLMADNETLSDIIDSMGGPPDETLSKDGAGECKEGGFWITSKCADHCWELDSEKANRQYEYLVDIGVCESSVVVQKSQWIQKTDQDFLLVEGAAEMLDQGVMTPTQLFKYLDVIKEPGYTKDPKQCFYSVRLIDLGARSIARWENIEQEIANRVGRLPVDEGDRIYPEIRKLFPDDICKIASATIEKPQEKIISNLNSYQNKLNMNGDIENKVIFADLDMSSFSNNISRQCNNSSHLSSNKKIKNEEITIEFSIEVNEKGRANSVELTSNNPNLIGSNLNLSKMAISSLKKSSYIAATENGEPITSLLIKKLRFPQNFCG